VSSLSVLASLFAVYLQIRRSRFTFGFYIINDIILIALWGIPVLSGNMPLLSILLNPVINFINDSYGLYNWKKMEKIQKKELILI
jgi:nicotinamide riboside transporter PnuC